MNKTWTSEERDLLKELQRYIGKKKKTSNSPTPKASAWQALTCLAVAKAKEEHPTPNVEVGGQMAKLAAQSSIQHQASLSALAKRGSLRI